MTQDTNKKEELPLALAVQVTLLEDNELILYTDENGEQHVYTSKPYDNGMEYTVLPLYYNDIKDE